MLPCRQHAISATLPPAAAASLATILQAGHEDGLHTLQDPARLRATGAVSMQHVRCMACMERCKRAAVQRRPMRKYAREPDLTD